MKILFPAEMARDDIVETMHYDAVNAGFELRNSPFYVYGVSNLDVVGAEVRDEILTFTHVVRRGGHSTYRLLVIGEAQAGQFAERWPLIESKGCTYEEGGRQGERLYSIDIPPGVDVHTIYVLLEKGEADAHGPSRKGTIKLRNPVARHRVLIYGRTSIL